MEDRAERGSEKLPTKQEILDRLGLENYEITKELSSDADGLYRLEITVQDSDGGKTEYTYCRKGNFPGVPSEDQTHISDVKYPPDYNPDRDVPYGAKIFVYDHDIGQWLKHE
jgi:hypothetical protein